jgi:N-acetylneuraminic acid mutarotase
MLLLVSCSEHTKSQVDTPATTIPSPDDTNYKWEQVLPFGNGSFQEEWKPGTFPLGITPVLAFDDNLWMTGQKASWSSSDGINWTSYKKKDWGERIYQSYVYFNNRLWMYGGMKYQERQPTNEIWSSADGKTWEQSGNAEWQPRKGSAIIVFKNKLWLFGGAMAVSHDFIPGKFMNDIWSSTDGLHWTAESGTAPWSPRENATMLVFNDNLYMFGGNGQGDIWRSVDGITWVRQVSEVIWKQRHDFGAVVFDHKMWIYGGRDTQVNHTKAAKNDVWYSTDGIQWNRQTGKAPWTVRSGSNSVVFKNKLWIFSGKHTGGEHNWGGDIWTMNAGSVGNQ